MKKKKIITGIKFVCDGSIGFTVLRETKTKEPSLVVLKVKEKISPGIHRDVNPDSVEGLITFQFNSVETIRALQEILDDLIQMKEIKE